ncbi:hypothetical protein E1091_18525 [Micromonospora fluostatini]|uniref:Uncharacterized protein n=1 Tax=Micromonospora fluostatini TaxID=1629071 RepID=A0ABY2DCB6_9ACTN|nr:hypothetical protein E1091_18525 [Micromonospora fluostatini]
MNGSWYEDITTGHTVGAGFTLLGWRARVRPSSGEVTLWIYVRNDVAINILAGANITDTTCFTVPASVAPPDFSSCGWGNGVNHGEGVVEPTGAVVLRSATVNIAAPSNIRIRASYSL